MRPRSFYLGSGGCPRDLYKALCRWPLHGLVHWLCATINAGRYNQTSCLWLYSGTWPLNGPSLSLLRRFSYSLFLFLIFFLISLHRESLSSDCIQKQHPLHLIPHSLSSFLSALPVFTGFLTRTLRYTQEANTSALAIEPSQPPALLNLYHPTGLGATTQYSQDSTAFYQPVSQVFPGLDIRSRLNSK